MIETEFSRTPEKILDLEGSAREMEVARVYIEKTLDGERLSEIQEPMRENCRVAVMIPAYNEGYDQILYSMQSLSEQEGVEMGSFEVNFIVNNDKKSAEDENSVFQENQRAIALIRYITGKSSIAPDGISKEQQTVIDQIRESGIVVHAIDKSSADVAEDENTVGTARNRVGAEICKRFLSASKKLDGIIAITDSDCTFSANYIQALVEAFKSEQVTGLLVGNLDFRSDPSLPNAELTKRALELFFEADGTFAQTDIASGIEEKIDSDNKETFMRGANMAVLVRTWTAVDGYPKSSSGGDLDFGRRVVHATGSLARTYDYTVTTMFRISDRVGSQGIGRIVEKVNTAVNDFVLGRAKRVLIEDMSKTMRFYATLKDAQKRDALTGGFILEQMRAESFLETNIGVEQYDLLANKIGSEQSAEADALIFKLIYPYYPTRDITDEIAQKMSLLEAETTLN